MKFTIKLVTQDLEQEYSKLNRKWQRSGDINDIEHGGVRYRKAKNSDGVEFISYYGLSNLPEGVKISNKNTGVFSFNDLLKQLPEVWNFADGENCGFDIGSLMSSAEAYNGFLKNNS